MSQPGSLEQLVAQSLSAVSQFGRAGSVLVEIMDRVAVPGGNTAAVIEASRDDVAPAWRAAFQATEDNERSKPIPPLITISGPA